MVFAQTLKNSSDKNSYDEVRNLVWVTLVLSVIHIFLPMKEINEKLFKIKGPNEVPAPTFDKIRPKFKTVN
jgi:hypothetical protein